MIKLNSQTFRNAIEKAQEVSPFCKCVDDETGESWTFQVARSAGNFAIVDIWVTGGVLWSSCDCFAGVGHKRGGNPMPCYHVAAVALSLGLLSASPVPVCDVSAVVTSAAPLSALSSDSLPADQFVTEVKISRVASAARGWLATAGIALASIIWPKGL
jgi:hypothetical protein